MNYMERYQEWLADPAIDEKTKAELRAIADDEKEIRERFTGDLEFGTAGLRGIIGAGTNRINIYSIRRATQGLADYIRKMGTAKQGVALAFDSRRMSTEFAREAALCLCANDIPIYIFPVLHPTPMLSFAIRALGCTSGINITASHNPPEYNGYKVYWADGAQISEPNDTGIAEMIDKVSYSGGKTMTQEEAEKKGLYHIIGPELDDLYMKTIKALVRRPEAIKAAGKDLKIVYTPLHGTGNLPVRRVLKELGFENVYVVPEQELPNGEFPTVSYPNPEVPEAFELGLELAKKVDADLVIATDPDADRFGMYVKVAQGDYMPFNGNMSGCFLAHYEISSMKEKGLLPENGQLVTTIVTSNMAAAIAKYNGVGYQEVLTGFKFICGAVRELDDAGKGKCLYGFEESYGCIIGTYARDKDGVSATMAMCEAAAYYRTKGMTLWDALQDLYTKVGYYREKTVSQVFKGLDGKAKMAGMMEKLRKSPLVEMGGREVLAIRDYVAHTRLDVKTGEVTPVTLPTSNVLYYELSGDAWCCVRPSGTEPKIKWYYGVRGDSAAQADARNAEMEQGLKELMDRISGD